MEKAAEEEKPRKRSLGARLGWTRASYALLSVFMVLIFLIGYVWWPLLQAYLDTYNPDYPFWVQFDWLLLGIFLAMTLLIMANAHLGKDFPIFAIGLAGGLVIESWGTQTSLWTYYTAERPPLWIIPAWPIASLSIDRLYRLLARWTKNWPEGVFRWGYWAVFGIFLGLMVIFVAPTLNRSLTVMALVLCVFLILTPVDRRAMVLVFAAGAGLGYFLERWGTTRECWTYYTRQTPPFFAVLAHGMAAVAFWRVLRLYELFWPRVKALLGRRAPERETA
ncbi:hypothetical protein [Levilinea saccharolytica]|uniref:Uncharacterized protein n=1 Tax=Levilinea saccharolytica TaxID=229921 RepID=A0A0P6YC71_9CHLR|nr:hypothetical protein [Levilinea saccharolytica]KPL79591.1 hypothetical protein ADN01_13940 [Levilinea saccharolytica]GAP17393.1 hypothetical protein LSAC_01263 [Levilinea saccharolytica]